MWRHLCCLWDPGETAEKADAVPGPGLSALIYVRRHLLGQFSHQAGGCSGKVNLSLSLFKILKYFLARMGLLVTLFLVLINIFNSVRLVPATRNIFLNWLYIQRAGTHLLKTECHWLVSRGLHLPRVQWVQIKPVAISRPSHLLYSGALMEYAVILFLLKTRRKPKRNIDQVRALIIYSFEKVSNLQNVSRISRICLTQKMPTMAKSPNLCVVRLPSGGQPCRGQRPWPRSRLWWRTSMPGQCGWRPQSSYSGISATGWHTGLGPTDWSPRTAW